jgi:hypothetical protein
MQPWQTIAIGVAVLVIAAAIGLWMYQRSRTRHLRERFGPEYDRRITEVGNRRQVEAALAKSEARLAKAEIRPLSATDRSRFADEWRRCQSRFVDDPAGADEEADGIVTMVMRARGYEVGDPDERLTDICAAYPEHASNYRSAYDVVARHRRRQASTEDLRAAFLNFRSLFDDMLGGRDEELKRVS